MWIKIFDLNIYISIISIRNKFFSNRIHFDRVAERLRAFARLRECGEFVDPRAQLLHKLE